MSIVRKLFLSLIASQAVLIPAALTLAPTFAQAQTGTFQLWTETPGNNDWTLRGTFPSLYDAELAAMSWRRAGFIALVQ